MGSRFGSLYNEGFYHVYNRGADKRVIFHTEKDVERFLLVLQILNSTKALGPVGDSIRYGNLEEKIIKQQNSKLVNVIALAVVANHYHLVIQQVEENGVSRFMQKIGSAYTNYYNEKYKHEGVIFKGPYGFTELSTTNDVIKSICYVNLNEKIHHAKTRSHQVYTSHDSYLEGDNTIKNFHFSFKQGREYFGSTKSYLKLSASIVKEIAERRESEKKLQDSES